MTARNPRQGSRTGAASVAVEATVPDREARRPGSAAPVERLAYSVDEAALLIGLSRDLLYDEMRRGHLSYRKIGRRRLITRQHLEEFLGLLPRPRAPLDNTVGDFKAAGEVT